MQHLEQQNGSPQQRRFAGQNRSATYREHGKALLSALVSQCASGSQTLANHYSPPVAWRVQRSLPVARTPGHNENQNQKTRRRI